MIDNASRRRSVDGYQPSWDLDLAYGEQGQLFVADIGEAIRNGAIEVKRDGRWFETGNVFVEYRCLRASGQWERSGLAATDALLWAFVLGDTETAIIMPTGQLRTIARDLLRRHRWYQVEEHDGSHPTKGVRIPLVELIHSLQRREADIRRGAS